MTEIVVLQRIRNQIIGYLGVACSFEKQSEYQRVAPVCVANEIINQWEDWVQPDWRDEFGPPVFSLEEVEAIAGFDATWRDVVDNTPNPLPQLEDCFGMKEWQQLASAAAGTLAVFMVRGSLGPDGEMQV